jgi:hypothetical protein
VKEGVGYELYGCNKDSKCIIRATKNYYLKYIHPIPLSGPTQILLALEFSYIILFSGAVNHKTTIVTRHIASFKV